MSWQRRDLEAPTRPPLRQHMRVLRDEAELAAATARAAEGERRLQDRLETRAAHEAKAAVQDVERPALRWPSGLRTGVLPPPRRTPLLEEVPGKAAPPAA